MSMKCDRTYLSWQWQIGEKGFIFCMDVHVEWPQILQSIFISHIRNNERIRENMKPHRPHLLQLMFIDFGVDHDAFKCFRSLTLYWRPFSSITINIATPADAKAAMRSRGASFFADYTCSICIYLAVDLDIEVWPSSIWSTTTRSSVCQLEQNARQYRRRTKNDRSESFE